jgi:hypothetical protein
MHINLEYQGAAQAPEQQGFRDGMQVAATLLENAFDDNITINIAVGYGEFNGTTLKSQGSSEGDIVPVNISYTKLIGHLLSHAFSSDDYGSLATLPDDTALQGQTTFRIGTAQAKALAILPANDGGIDGYVGMGTTFTGNILIGVALHELTHAMGRVSGSSLDLFRYTTDPVSGQIIHLLGNPAPMPAAYFSVDGGTTHLADFGQTSDAGDFSPSSPRNQPFDPFNEGGNIASSLTTVDMILMDVLGYHRADDYAENTTTTGSIPVNGAAFGNIERFGDHDWFRVDLAAFQSYRIEENGAASGQGSLTDPLLSIYDSLGQLVRQRDGGTSDARLYFTPLQSGIYYVDASGQPSGTYTVRVTADDYANDPSTVGVIDSNSLIEGKIETAGDTDWFRVYLVAGQSYRFDEYGATYGWGETLPDPLMQLYDSASHVVATNDNAYNSLDSRLFYTPSASGYYYVQAGSANGTAGKYEVTLRTDDYDNTPRTTGLIANGTATGSIETPHDTDWFKISLTAGQSYRIEENGALSKTQEGTLSSTSIKLYDGSGRSITNGSISGKLFYTPSAPGDYYVEAGVGVLGGTATGTYTVHVTPDDFDNTVMTTGTVKTGGAATGNIEVSGDHDWFAISLTAGITYRFNLDGRDANAGTLSDPYLRLYDGWGSKLPGEDNDSGPGLGSQPYFTPITSATYYLDAGANSTQTGTYRMSAAVANTPDDFNGDGHSDVIWLNTDGRVMTWDMTGVYGQKPVSHVFGPQGQGWHIDGTGDFNGDGRSEILWRDANGSVMSWEMNGAQKPAFYDFGNVGNAWQIAGTGDFNGDGKTDVLWRNDNGSVTTWEMNGTQKPAVHDFGSMSNAWHILGTGDFNGDGKTDVLLRNDNGSVRTWEMNGAEKPVLHDFGTMSNTWRIAATGDFSGDGKSDILWRNDNGRVMIWDMNGGDKPTIFDFGTFYSSWHIAGTGDFNGDGKAEILVRIDDGSVMTLDLNGTQAVVSHTMIDVLSSDWHMGKDTTPVAAINNQTLHVSEWAQVDSWLTSSDADGDAVTKYQFMDNGTDASSGYIFTSGNAHNPSGTAIEVSASDLANVWVRGGAVAGSESMMVRGFDGARWGDWDLFTLTTRTETPPVVTAANVTAAHGQSFAASGLMSVSDADGDAITQYAFWNSGTGGGHFVLNGVAQGVNQEIDVSAAQLAQLSYRSGSGADTLWVKASDGLLWSGWSNSFTVTAPIDAAPTVSVSNLNAGHGQSFAATALFAAHDADDSAMAQYAFWNSGTGGGHFVLNGVAQGVNQEIDVSAAQFSKLTYQSGSGADTLWVRVNDGLQWSAWSNSFTVTAPVDSGPTVTPIHASTKSFANQIFAASSLFTYSDPFGSPATQYDVWNSGAGGGHFLLNGTALPANADNIIPAAQLSQLSYQVGTGSDTLWVRANDGTVWGAWSSGFTMADPPAVAAGETITLGSAYAGKVDFLGDTGTLKLEDSSSFAGTVAGLHGQDAIDLADIGFGASSTLGYSSNADNSGGTLSVGDGTNMANIALLGSYMASTFAAASDGHGGTLISEAAHASTQMPVVTQPHP